MSSGRRLGSADSPTRAKLIETAAELMREEGHNAVTVRRLAERAQVKRQIVHYYFRSMEELYLEVVRRSAERYLARQRELLSAPGPLQAIWELVRDPGGIRLEIEFMAIANQMPSVRELLAGYMTRSREIGAEALRGALDAANANGGVRIAPDPEALALMLRAVARTLATEANMGVTHGHAAALATVAELLSAYGSNATNAKAGAAR